MIETALGLTSAFTSPHRVASKIGSDVLEAGGSAIGGMAWLTPSDR